VVTPVHGCAIMEALLESLVAMGFPRGRAEMAISATEGAGVLGHRIRLVTHPNPLHIPS